jgi:light-regulated signal transduction histidine kinase (bacteriophytochrome)
MAYVTQEVITKARIALKALNKEYGVKATLSGKNDSTLYLTIAEGSIDFIGNYCENVKAKRIQHDTQQVIDWVTKEQNVSVNQYYLDSSFSGVALEYLEKAKAIMYVDHWDKSDIQSDYFHCAYYVNINVGRWNKPYKFQN